MLRGSKVGRGFNVWPPNNPRAVIRLGLGLLVAANLVAAYFVIRPIGGSTEELSQQALEMHSQIRQQQGVLERTRALVSKIESGRGEGDQFMGSYFLPRRAAYSTIMAELNDLASQSKIASRDSAWALEPVEGSDTLDLLQISANFEGTYPDLVRFVNLLDKSNRLLIIESLNATPQQTGGRLNVMLKLDTFVQEDGAAQ
jgi:Tfp pilus assembly protein PilO